MFRGSVGLFGKYNIQREKLVLNTLMASVLWRPKILWIDFLHVPGTRQEQMYSVAEGKLGNVDSNSDYVFVYLVTQHKVILE